MSADVGGFVACESLFWESNPISSSFFFLKGGDLDDVIFTCLYVCMPWNLFSCVRVFYFLLCHIKRSVVCL